MGNATQQAGATKNKCVGNEPKKNKINVWQNKCHITKQMQARASRIKLQCLGKNKGSATQIKCVLATNCNHSKMHDGCKQQHKNGKQQLQYKTKTSVWANSCNTKQVHGQ